MLDCNPIHLFNIHTEGQLLIKNDSKVTHGVTGGKSNVI